MLDNLLKIGIVPISFRRVIINSTRMIISRKSSRGGMPLAHFDESRNQETIILHKRETGEPVILNDYITYAIGYATQEVKPGDKQFMKYSDVEFLVKKLAPMFGYKRKWFRSSQ